MLVGGQEWPFRLFEVLTRNRQSALELCGRSRRAPLQPPRMFTIPPRQELSSPNWLAIRARRVTRARIRIRIRIRIRLIPIRWYKTYARETCSKRTLEKKLVKHSHRIQISPHKRNTIRERKTRRQRARKPAVRIIIVPSRTRCRRLSHFLSGGRNNNMFVSFRRFYSSFSWDSF